MICVKFILRCFTGLWLVTWPQYWPLIGHITFSDNSSSAASQAVSSHLHLALLVSLCKIQKYCEELPKQTIVSIPVIHKIMSLGKNETRVVNNPLHKRKNKLLTILHGCYFSFHNPIRVMLSKPLIVFLSQSQYFLTHMYSDSES